MYLNTVCAYNASNSFECLRGYPTAFATRDFDFFLELPNRKMATRFYYDYRSIISTYMRKVSDIQLDVLCLFGRCLPQRTNICDEILNASVAANMNGLHSTSSSSPLHCSLV